MSHDVEKKNEKVNISTCFFTSIQLLQLGDCIFTSILSIYHLTMSYNNVTEFIAALKAMDARVRATIFTNGRKSFSCRLKVNW
jgi:hypothetical protein